MHRAIVRAAMVIDEVELVAEFNRTENEEYGVYIFIFTHDECGFISELNEDDGSLREFRDLEECRSLLAQEYLEQYSGQDDVLQEIREAISVLNNR